MQTTTTSPFAILDDACERIVETHDLTDSERDQMAARYGRRLVYLPMGGEAGDRVTVDEDGEAEVVDEATGPYRVRVIGTGAPGEVLASYDDEDEARDHATAVAHEYHYGTCIEDGRGRYDCGDGEWVTVDEAWSR